MYDAAIVGGGLAGSLAATLLARAGRSAAVIDLHAVYPPDFRAEQLVGQQVSELERMGLLGDLLGSERPVDRAVVAHRGRILGQADAPHYSIRYENLVSRARASIPRSVPVLSGRVVDVRTGFDVQEVVLADGRQVRSRLVIMAGGLQVSLLRRMGFEHRRIRDAHSLIFGFGVAPAQQLPYPVLVYQGEWAAERIDYLSMFPMDGAIRANLFTYREARDPWAQEFRRSPQEGLRRVMPRLEKVLGPFRVTGPVSTRVIDLYAVSNPVRDGIVLVGDAYQTSCPAAGTGISRLLTDIECLCKAHIPAWLASPGMAAEKIASFYADPRKVFSDLEAEGAAHYRRALASEGGLIWRLHRAQLQLRQWIGGTIGGPERLTTGIRPLRGASQDASAAVPPDPFVPAGTADGLT